jgi:hypothetical protein
VSIGGPALAYEDNLIDPRKHQDARVEKQLGCFTDIPARRRAVEFVTLRQESPSRARIVNWPFATFSDTPKRHVERRMWRFED